MIAHGARVTVLHATDGVTRLLSEVLRRTFAGRFGSTKPAPSVS